MTKYIVTTNAETTALMKCATRPFLVVRQRKTTAGDWANLVMGRYTTRASANTARRRHERKSAVESAHD